MECSLAYLYVDEQYLLTYLLTHSLTFSLHAAQLFLRNQPVLSYSRNSPHFMEPEGSLPHSQVPATCPYPEPHRCSPFPHIVLPEDPSEYYPPIYIWVFQMVSFSQVSPQNRIRILLSTLHNGGRAVAQWLRHYATNRNVVGPVPDGIIGIFQWHNPSGRTMALGSTQPLTEMSTRSISWG